MLTLMPELTAFAHALFDSLWPSWSGWASQMFIWRKVGPVRKVIVPSQKGDPATQVTLLVEPTFCFYVNGSPRFLNKYMKRWLHQGSLGRGSSDPFTQNIFFFDINGNSNDITWHSSGINFLPVVVLHMYFLGSLRSFLKVAIMSSS